MLAQASCLTYVHEPFNINNSRLWSLGFDYWFKYITDENAHKYRSEVKNLHSLSFPLSRIFTRARQEATSPREFGNRLKLFLKEYVRCLRSRIRGSRPLIKDPIAVLSAEWLAETLDAQVVVMVRHPAAFAGSLKVKNWTFSFSNFTGQTLLMNDLLSPFEEEIRAFEERERGIIDQAGLLWKILYSVVHNYQQQHEDWIFLRHEEISRSPVKSFASAYDSLGLNFTKDIEATIHQHSEGQGSGGIERDSKSVVRNWEDRLTDQEVQRVRSLTEPKASLFYDDSDW